MKISTRRRNTNLTSAKWQLTIESFRPPGKDFVRTKKGTFLQSLARSLVRDEKTKKLYKPWTTGLLYICAKKPDAVDSDVASGSCRKETDREIVTVKTSFPFPPTKRLGTLPVFLPRNLPKTKCSKTRRNTRNIGFHESSTTPKRNIWHSLIPIYCLKLSQHNSIKTALARPRKIKAEAEY